MPPQSNEELVRMRAPADKGGGYNMVPASEVDWWRKKGAVVAPEQTAGELGYRATKSLNPVEWYQGAKQAISDPFGTASNIAQVPINLAGQAVDEFKQGNYGTALRKGATAAVPFAAAGLGALAAGASAPVSIPAALLATGGAYLAGTGVAAGMDEAADQLSQGNYATGAGAAIDAGVQTAMARPYAGAAKPPMSAAEQAAALEGRVQRTAARTLAPTIGEGRYELGNEARRLGSEMFKKTTGWSIEGMASQLENLRSRATANLNAAYDLIPNGVKMKTADVRRGLMNEWSKTMVQQRNGTWAPVAGKQDYAAAIKEAIDQLDTYPATLGAKDIRNIRQGWDNLAEFKPRKTSDKWTKTDLDKANAYKEARTILNEQTKRVFPHLEPQMAETSFAIGATDLLRAFEETESARSRIGRRITSAAGGTMAGLLQGGPIGGAVGAFTAPIIEYLMTERLGPGGKIQAARTMAKMAEELRTNGQTPQAMKLARELKMITQTFGRAGRAEEAATTREEKIPQIAPVASHEQSWFDTQRQGSRTPGGVDY